jgi:hypothetical protein
LVLGTKWYEVVLTVEVPVLEESARLPHRLLVIKLVPAATARDYRVEPCDRPSASVESVRDVHGCMYNGVRTRCVVGAEDEGGERESEGWR